uniref:Endonuclease/exonuclease/phosphatase domain-containing protein n=1 Tax=Megaselia scalaris TaxID=36166 RepID=T1GUW3_MEGSC
MHASNTRPKFIYSEHQFPSLVKEKHDDIPRPSQGLYSEQFKSNSKDDLFISNLIKIVHWNAQGISNISKITELNNLLDNLNIDIVLLNETFLKPNHKFYLNNFNILRSDRETMEVELQLVSTTNTPRTYNEIYSYKEANWINFKSFIDEELKHIIIHPNSVSIDTALHKFSSTILLARNKYIPKRQQINKSLEISSNTKLCISERNRIKRKLQRCQNSTEKNVLSSIVRQLNSLIRQNIFNDRNKSWSNMLSKLEPGDNKFWKITKFKRGKSNNNIGTLIVNNCK